jgi:hypothetical protein
MRMLFAAVHESAVGTSATLDQGRKSAPGRIAEVKSTAFKDRF